MSSHVLYIIVGPPAQGEETNSAEGGEPGSNADVGENQGGGDGHQSGKDDDGTENKEAGEGGQQNPSQPDSSPFSDGNSENNTMIADASVPNKKRFSWLPIIIIVAAIVALILIGLVILIIRKRNSGSGYNQAPTSDNAAGPTAAAKA